MPSGRNVSAGWQTPDMETAQLIEDLQREGALLAEAAERAGWDAGVPSCPDWTVHDLVAHTGRVHRWATGFVTQGHTEPRRPPQEPELAGAELLTWFRAGHAALVDALRAAPADLECWTFLPGSSPLAFWARRQAHETAVHRVDAELALAAGVSPIDAEFAADGIAELLTGFHGQGRSRARSPQPGVLRLESTDTATHWTVRLSTDPPIIERTTAPTAPPPHAGPAGIPGQGDTAAECVLIGSTADLYLTLWNRPSSSEVRTEGDAAVAARWRETAAIV